MRERDKSYTEMFKECAVEELVSMVYGIDMVYIYHLFILLTQLSQIWPQVTTEDI